MKKIILSAVSFLLFNIVVLSQDDIVVTTVPKAKTAAEIQLSPDTVVADTAGIVKQDTVTAAPQKNNEDLKSEITLSKVPMGTDVISLGFGKGIDYGGFGGSVLYYSQRNLGIFAGAGYNTLNFAYNFGLKLRLLPKRAEASFSFHGIMMYGSNIVLKVTDATELSKTFNGFTFGLGFDERISASNGAYFTTSLLIPVRGKELYDYMDKYGLVLQNGFSPVDFSIGLRIVLK